jgi:hypothetical protein
MSANDQPPNSIGRQSLQTSKALHYGLLSSITVPPGIKIEPKGLVLIVGPNSAGKTQLLKDLQSILTGQARDLVVCSDFQIEKPPNLELLLESLYAEGYLRKHRDPNGNEYIQQTSPHLGGGAFRGHNMNVHQVPQHFNKLQTVGGGSRRVEQSPFLDLVGHCLTTALFLENRLTMANQCGQFDYASTPPNSDLQALYLNKSAKLKLTEETQSVFGKGVWLDNTRGGILCLRVNQSPAVPAADDRHEPEEMKKFRQIESEGDGMRSYVGICIAMLLGRRPVCILDEPELCLHPPQAYAMGRFIGRHGTSSEHATFASTHSSHVLRGIIEATEQVQILRLTKVGGEFRGHMIGYGALQECMRRPIVRAETILDGIFADAVTIVESEGDRAVYQAAWEGLRAKQQNDSPMQDQTRRDVLFIPVGGTGGIADIANFYRTLRIPTAIIADLDLLLDKDKLERILQITGDSRLSAELMEKCRMITNAIRSLPPTILAQEVSISLRSIAASEMEWKNDDDIRVKSELGKLTQKIDRMRRLKNGGVEAFHDQPSIRDDLRYVIARCKTFGLFLVPVGELEYWAPNLMTDGPSKSKKAEWANDAAMKIRQNPGQATDLLQFMREMAEYHAAETLRMA